MKQIIKQITKEVGIIFLVVALLILASAVAIYSYFSSDNVFDQLHWEVKKAEYGMDSVLVSGTESAYVDYDFGMFASLQIPELDMAMSFHNNELHFLFFDIPDPDGPNSTQYVHYRYNFEDNTLYGERSVEFLKDHLLTFYFQWCKNAGIENSFSLDDLGEFTFILRENVYYGG
ncbi:MAG: hypothetical protein IJF02_03325 [Oscillospiraceae bacterium]|nr:hypothetical protein [Oscillospiraceae bacterium]